MTYELIPQPSAGYAEVRIDGRTVARIDLMLLSVLADDTRKRQHLQELGWPGNWQTAPFLEAVAVSRPGKDV